MQSIADDGKTSVSGISFGLVNGGEYYTAQADGTRYARLYIPSEQPVGAYITFRNPMIQFVEYYKAPVKPYAPYTRRTYPIPAEVQALEGYGQGNPTGTEYNYIDYTRRVFVQKGYRDANGAWIPTGREIDISAYLPADNFIEVEGGGIVTAVNEDKLAAPTKIEYQLKEATA